MVTNKHTTPFSHLLGQPRAKNLLERALASGRIAHAYLFRGPEGVGKTLFAAAFAQALNCSVSGPGLVCGDCSSCRKFRSGSHPDYIVERPEKGAIKIDRVRELCRSLSYTPYESEKRVMVFEDVHTMRPEAANCLLKTLEEPPENNVLVLTAEASQSVLSTISSRCQIIPFFPLNLGDAVEILTKEEHGIERDSAAVLARLAEGSPGRALLFHSTEMVEVWQQVTRALSDPGYGDDRHIGKILQLAEQMAELKENLQPLFGLLRIWLRDLLVERTTGNGSGRTEENKEGRRFTASGVETIFAGSEAIDVAEQQLSRNCNRSLVCEILLFRLQCV